MIKFSHNSLKILIIRLSSFGDIIKTSALPRLLKNKFPNCKITFITKSNFKELIEHNPNIDIKIYFEKKSFCTDLSLILNLRKQILKNNYDIIIDAHNNTRSRILTSFLTPPFLARYHKPRFKRALLFLFNINFLTKIKTLEYEFYKLIKPLDISYDEKGSELYFENNFNYQNLFKKYDLEKIKYICLVPGAAWKGKILDNKIYKELINIIKIKKTDYKIVVLGGKKEIKNNMNFEFSNTINLTNKLNLLESVFIASKAVLTLGSDTGLIHASEAAGGKIGVFLGPTSRETGAMPSRTDSLIFQKTLFCRPCSKNGSGPCIWGFGKRSCLNFNAQEIYSSIKSLL
jgi:heptosyltransferase II